MLGQIALILSITLGFLSLITVAFHFGATYRTLQSLRKTAHELTNWKQGLMDLMDLRYIRRDMFDERVNRIVEDLEEIKTNMERRNTRRQ